MAGHNEAPSAMASLPPALRAALTFPAEWAELGAAPGSLMAWAGRGRP